MKKVVACLIILLHMFVNSYALCFTFKANPDSYDGYATVLVYNDKSEIRYANQFDLNDTKTLMIDIPIDDETFLIKSNVNVREGIVSDYVYISDSGDDANDGMSANNPIKSLLRASEILDENQSLCVVGTYSISGTLQKFDRNLKIMGLNSESYLNIGERLLINCGLEIDKIKISGEPKIYANGYTLIIGEGVTSDSRIEVYGGSDESDLTGNTDIRLYGGQYSHIYGGGYYKKVYGKTNITIGGRCNPNDEIDDSMPGVSKCYVFGGSNCSDVIGGGSAIVLEGRATVRGIYGGSQYGSCTKSDICIKGGRATAVYGGSRTRKVWSDSKITMQGGIVESIFGGSDRNDFVGNTVVILEGGQVTRRVYTGCYNDWSFGWKSDCSVDGTTTLIIGKDAGLNTRYGLSSGNNLNVGVFSGSRMNKQKPTEKNLIVFKDGCYDAQRSSIGDKSHKYYEFESFDNIELICSGDGDAVLDKDGKVNFRTKTDTYPLVNSKESESICNLADGSYRVDFVSDFRVKNVSVNIGETVRADVQSIGSVKSYGDNCIIYLALFENEKLAAVKDMKLIDFDGNAEFDIELKKENKYQIKILAFDENQRPKMQSYSMSVK